MNRKKKYIRPQFEHHHAKLQNNMCDLHSQIGIGDGIGEEQWSNMRDVGEEDEEMIDINEGFDF